MSFQTYITGIPAANNNPSNDQPNMLTNTNSIPVVLAIDHFGFNDNNGGLHKQVTMPVQSGVPSTATVGMGVLYTKTASSLTPLNESDLFFSPDASGNQYQLTRTITGSFASFGGGPGWTFLPGGLIMQYGSVATVSNNTSVSYPVTFPIGTISLTFGSQNNTTTTSVAWAKSVSASGFVINVSVAATPFVFWMAIGK